MELELKIGPYKLFKRTPYSKLQVLDENDENITRNTTGEKIISDYRKQIEDKDKYFRISSDTLFRYEEMDNIDFLFIPEGVQTINPGSFEDSSFKFVYFPDSLEQVDERAFLNCRNLEEIILPSNFKSLKGTGIFDSCVNLSKVILPNSLKIIPEFAFCNCKSLREIVIPKEATELEERVFSGCTNLEKVILPDKLHYIGTYAFCGCISLKEITLPKNFNAFGHTPFAASGVKTLIFNHNSPKNILGGWGKFLMDSHIQKIVIGKEVTMIEPIFFEYIKEQIKEIEYKGTKKEFEIFKSNNEELFDLLKIAKITLKEDLIKNDDVKDLKKIKDLER